MPLNGGLAVADEFRAIPKPNPSANQGSLQTRIEQRRQLNQPQNANAINPSVPDWLQFSHPQTPITQQGRNTQNQVSQNQSVNELGNAANSAVAASVQYKQEAAARRALAQNQALSERQQSLLSQFGNLDFSSGGGAPLTNATGKRAQVIKMGERLLGQPYQWGGGHGSLRVGPVDCSGLVNYAFGKAGIKGLNGVSQSQMSQGTPTKISKLLPGDLVGVGHPAHHVAIWLGGGKILVAPHTGTNVQIQNIGNGSGWWGIHLNY